MLILPLFLSASVGVISPKWLAQKIDQNRQDSCHPVGRVLNRNSRGELVCSSDWVNPPPGQRISLLCFYSTNMVLVERREQVGVICAQRPPHNPCPVEELRRCSIFRAQQPSSLLYPYGTVHRQLRPTFAWQSVPQATHYRISIAGVWEQTTSMLSLSYPLGEVSLQPGRTYSVSITAFRDDQRLSTQTANYLILPQQTLDQITANLQQLTQNSDTQTIATRELQSLFISYGLWDDAIGVLQQKIRAGTVSPSVYRVLGDRYLELGLVALARDEYNRALALADRERNNQERLLAQRGLNEADKFPTPLQPTP